MTDRIFEDECSWEVSRNNSDFFEVYCNEELRGKIQFGVNSNGGECDSYFWMDAEEATALKEFLIRKGY